MIDVNEDRYVNVGKTVRGDGRPYMTLWSCKDCGITTTNREKHEEVSHG